LASESRQANDQRKRVEADSERITQEALECKAISDDAEAELKAALPGKFSDVLHM
jgi:dynein heavy chain